jgi:hypothetical protein
VLRKLVIKLLINPLIRNRTRYFRQAYHLTRDNTYISSGANTTGPSEAAELRGQSHTFIIERINMRNNTQQPQQEGGKIKYYQDVQIKGDTMGMGKMRSAYRTSV